jgi:hypothetical protein
MALTDWYFPTGLVAEIDDSQYVSAPSSLKLTDPNDEQYRIVVCTREDLKRIQQGRIETYLRHQTTNDGFHGLVCRANQLSYSHTPSSYIVAEWDYWGVHVYCFIGGVFKWGDEGPAAQGANVWNRMRFTWWTEGNQLFYVCENYVAGAWVVKLGPKGHTVFPINASGLYACGIETQVVDSERPWTWWDDTRIFEKVV